MKIKNDNIISDPTKKFINGPINIVRIEGKVNGIKKVLYVFMDIHISCQYQTRCQNIFSVDIEKFLADSFYDLNEKNKIYDFFLEIFPTEIINVSYGYPYDIDLDYKEIYIEEVVKLFNKIFKIDPKKKTVLKPDIFKNIRLHYADIRNYFKGTVMNNLLKSIKTLNKLLMMRDLSYEEIDMIIKTFKNTHQYYQNLNYIYEDIKKNLLKPKKLPPMISSLKKDKKRKNIDDLEYLIYVLYKIIHRYEHESIKQYLNEYLEEHFLKIDDLMKQIEDFIDRFKKYMEVIIQSKNRLFKQFDEGYYYNIPNSDYRQIAVDFINESEEIELNFVNFHARLMDIFFLRRLIDKNYITNGITYTGAAHSVFYIWFLVKNFDFKVTHYSYSSEKNIKKMTKDIKDSKDEKNIEKIFYPEYQSQCSDISNFPKNFE